MSWEMKILLAHTWNAERQKDNAWICGKGGLRVWKKELAKAC